MKMHMFQLFGYCVISACAPKRARRIACRHEMKYIVTTHNIYLYSQNMFQYHHKFYMGWNGSKRFLGK